MSMSVRIETKGPIFSKRGPAIIQEAVHVAVKELVSLGEERLAQTLRPRPAGVYLSVTEAGRGKASTGHYRRNISGRVSNLHGLITDGGVVYGPWLEGVSSRNATTRFKGYASFRKVGDWLQKQARRVANAHVKRLVRRLGG